MPGNGETLCSRTSSVQRQWVFWREVHSPFSVVCCYLVPGNGRSIHCARKRRDNWAEYGVFLLRKGNPSFSSLVLVLRCTEFCGRRLKTVGCFFSPWWGLHHLAVLVLASSPLVSQEPHPDKVFLNPVYHTSRPTFSSLFPTSSLYPNKIKVWCFRNRY